MKTPKMIEAEDAEKGKIKVTMTKIGGSSNETWTFYAKDNKEAIHKFLWWLDGAFLNASLKIKKVKTDA